MKKAAIVVDVDNTVIDTAVRKRSILSQMFKGSQQEVTLEGVRKDFQLDAFLGQGKTANRQAFMEILSSEQGIRQHPAPAFEGAAESLKSLENEGITLVYLTARPEALQESTIEELRAAKIPLRDENLLMLDDPCLDTQQIPTRLYEFKTKTLEGLLERFEVLALIGDRPDDFKAAQAINVPFVLFDSSLSAAEVKFLQRERHVGFFVHSSWHTIPGTVRDLQQGTNELKQLRNAFSEQYATWLGQLDAKCGILIAMSGGLSTLAGVILLNELETLSTVTDKWNLSCAVLALAIICGVLAMLFGIRGYTSRRTSGSFSGGVILTSLKQAVAIVLGFPKSWSYRPTDPIDDFNRIRKAPLPSQSRAHYDFLFSRYGCYDLEALSNLRLYELRATNYQKVYAERWGSRLATCALLLIGLWLIMKAAAIMT